MIKRLFAKSKSTRRNSKTSFADRVKQWSRSQLNEAFRLNGGPDIVRTARKIF